MSTDIPGDPDLGTVVVGVDGSAPARRAALWAAAEANRRRRPLRIVYAADLDRLTLLASGDTIDRIHDIGREALLEAALLAQERFPDVTVVRELSRKSPVAALRLSAGPQDTIVVGNRGLGGFAALMLGSVGLDVAARSRSPVAVVRGEPDAPGTGVVTAAVRGTTDGDWLPFAAREAQLRKATLRVLSMWNPLAHAGSVATMLDGPDKMAREHARHLETLTGPLHRTFPGLTLTTEVAGGTSAAGVLVEASRHTDVLVIGARRRPMGLGPGLGHVAHAVLHHANCPVMIVPRGAADGEET
ncbi:MULTISPECIES: universal stress protein [Streptomyces]|uniref:universal stress protein n=1 Tax=Streptomyces TaxID=1883 RepID=UPI0007CD6FFE|nr:universal stress protein UspA [Streptomyces noursei]